jgi:polyhydroxyalkanoate synthesis regulator phasin
MSEQNNQNADAPNADVQADEAAGFVKRLREAWLKTVGNYATDEGETQSLLHRLVGFGSLSAEEAKKVLADARHKIEENRKELDTRVDESLRKAVSRVVDPSAKELRRLEDRVSGLEQKLKELETANQA